MIKKGSLVRYNGPATAYAWPGRYLMVAGIDGTRIVLYKRTAKGWGTFSVSIKDVEEVC